MYKRARLGIGYLPQEASIFRNLSVEDNIKNTYLNPISFLYEEPTNLLKQEVREPAIYTAIITAIATGSSRMSEMMAIGSSVRGLSEVMMAMSESFIFRRVFSS